MVPDDGPGNAMITIYTSDAFRLFELVAGPNVRALNEGSKTPAEVFHRSDILLKALRFHLRAERAAYRNADARAVDVAGRAEVMLQSIETTKRNFAAEQAQRPR